MATDGAGTDATEEPAADPRAAYDYRGGEVERPGLVADLERLVDGEVRFDEYTRQLYATDASAYEMTPIGVVCPTSTADAAAVVEYCAEREIPVLPRGGGTSLAGQSVNEAVVLDFSAEMDGVCAVDPEARTVTAEPGVRLGDLNARLAEHGLKFAPDPAWGDKSVLGGAIGNNSTGSHSLKYGKTDAYVESVEAVLADGSVVTLGETPLAEIRAEADAEADALLPRIYAAVVRILDEEATEVDRRYPRLKRNVSGYSLDVLVEEARAGETVNLARLLAGSEGTLAVVTEATVSLEPVPETKAVALLTYDGLIEAMEDVEPILAHEPAAVEVLDDVLLDLARETTEFADVVAMLPDGTDAVLLVEFYATDDADGRRKVANLVADRVGGVETEAEPAPDAAATTDAERRALTAMEAHEAAARERFWKLRKSGNPILLSRTSDAKHVSFIEDTAIPAGNLPEYVAGFERILDEHDTFASYYAHAGPGVLHVRPLVDTKSLDGVERMESIADDVTDLVVELGGSVSGEHGDGRARTQWNRKLYGDRLWRVFRDLKTAFDPDWILNPGTVCGDHEMTEHLRFDPAYEFDAGFEADLAWENENGFQGMVELCHGCGGCRGPQETTGGVMCPTYRAAEEEIQSTRGRANLLRQAMSGDLDADATDVEFLDEVLDLCVGCKGCARDCPSGVDLAKMKAEVSHEHHRRHGVALRERLFANVETLSRLGSALAPLSNLAPRLPGARLVAERLGGIARERTLPTFERESLVDWFEARGPEAGIDPDGAERRALLVPDTYTNYSHPAAGRAAVRVLEAAGVHVDLADVRGSGRPPYSKGLLDVARERARETVEAVAPAVEAGWDVVVVEPSDAVMLQDEYRDLLEGPAVESVSAAAYGVCEYLDAFRLDERIAFDPVDEHLTYHGHCHQKATARDHHAVGVLRRAGYAVDPLDSTCCGMAGSFGYEAEHYSMSRAIGRILFDQVDASPGEAVVAPGASCRAQLGDRAGADGEPPHPVEKLAAALATDRPT